MIDAALLVRTILGIWRVNVWRNWWRDAGTIQMLEVVLKV